jgi:hypothetical protein
MTPPHHWPAALSAVAAGGAAALPTCLPVSLHHLTGEPMQMGGIHDSKWRMPLCAIAVVPQLIACRQHSLYAGSTMPACPCPPPPVGHDALPPAEASWHATQCISSQGASRAFYPPGTAHTPLLYPSSSHSATKQPVQQKHLLQAAVQCTRSLPPNVRQASSRSGRPPQWSQTLHTALGNMAVGP